MPDLGREGTPGEAGVDEAILLPWPPESWLKKELKALVNGCSYTACVRPARHGGCSCILLKCTRSRGTAMECE